MTPARILEILERVARHAPCSVGTAAGQEPVAIARLPATRPDGSRGGPPPMPGQREPDPVPEGKWLEIRARPTPEAADLEIRYLQDLGLIYASREPKGGSFESVAPHRSGSPGPTILGLTPRGDEFSSLARDARRLHEATELLAGAGGYSFNALLSELRRSARQDLKRLRKG